MVLSQHAKIRMQQRGIPPLIIDWLAAYGEIDHQGGGSELFYFTKKARNAITRDLGKRALRGYSKCLNAYMVVCNGGTIATVGHRYQRIIRH